MHTIYITIIQVTNHCHSYMHTIYILLSYKLQPVSFIHAHYIYYYHTSYNQCHSYMHTIYITIIQVTTNVIHTCTQYILLSYKLQTTVNHTCTLYILLSYKLQPVSFIHAHYIYYYHTSYNQCLLDLGLQNT